MGEAARKREDDPSLEDLALPRTSAHVRIDAFSEHNFWAGLSGDAAEGGVFIATHKTLPVGALLVVHVELPNEKQPIVVLADVSWTRPYSRDVDAPPGIGLEFIALDRLAQAKIRWFCGRVREPIFYDD